MPKKQAARIKAWSYSRWATYEECPLKAKLKFIDKLQEPQGAAAARGEAIHKLAEDYLMGRLKVMPEELKLFSKDFKELKLARPKVEEQLAFRSDWTAVGWFDPDAWLRVKMDASARVRGVPTVLNVVDHKTGKHRTGYTNQMELYGLTGLLLNPAVQTVRTALWFLDHGTRELLEVSRAKLGKLKLGWEKRVAPMLTDERFSPKPGKGCTWCAFGKTKGGCCKFG